MGLLETIADGLRSHETGVPTPKPPDLTESTQSPVPCPRCQSPAFWIDVYGGPPHCRFCQPPPAASMVRKFVWLVAPIELGADGELITRPYLAEFRDGREVTDVDQDQDDADRAGIRTATIERDGKAWTVLAAAHQVDVLRLPVKGSGADDGSGADGQPDHPGRYSPPLGVGPVGDLTLDEWAERLPRGLPGW